jgi:hypothetical protein
MKIDKRGQVRGRRPQATGCQDRKVVPFSLKGLAVHVVLCRGPRSELLGQRLLEGTARQAHRPQDKVHHKVGERLLRDIGHQQLHDAIAQVRVEGRVSQM